MLLSGVCTCQVHCDGAGTHGQPQAGELQAAQADRRGSLHARVRGGGCDRPSVAGGGQDHHGQGGQPRHQHRRHQAHT